MISVEKETCALNNCKLIKLCFIKNILISLVEIWSDNGINGF